MEHKKNGLIISSEELEEMRAVDIRTVNPDRLVDIDAIRLRDDLPLEERIQDYIRQIGNPYCFRCHGIAVKISFAGKKRLEECIRDAIKL